MLDYSLRPGVKLHIIPTNQFKTTQIVVNLTTKHEKKSSTYRSLLANVLELASMKYPDQNKIAKQMAYLYGARFGTDLEKYGQVHCFKYMLRLPNERYIDADQSLVVAGFDFLKEIIFNPLKNGDQFNKALFIREKNNMIADFKSIKEDRQTYAMQQLVDLYFNNEQATPSYGQLDELKKITNQSLTRYHQKMLAEDQVDIFVLGNVDKEVIITKASELPFMERTGENLKLFYQQALKDEVLVKTEKANLTQAKYNLAYHFDVNQQSDENYAAIVFNALLGATPLSKLFVNVREKASLAYYASSNYSPTNQLLTIQTGIDNTNLVKAKKIILQQITDIQAGKFSDLELNSVKKYLVNTFEASLDSPRTILNKAILNALLGRNANQLEWIKKVKDVTKIDVINIAKKLNLQATFLLAGEPDGKN